MLNVLVIDFQHGRSGAWRPTWQLLTPLRISLGELGLTGLEKMTTCLLGESGSLGGLAGEGRGHSSGDLSHGSVLV